MSIEAYEQNLQQRLAELRRGDPAYKLHSRVIWEAIIFANEMKELSGRKRILDVGCGLGFLSSDLTSLGDEVVGIDPSDKAIALAQKEHSTIQFYTSKAEEFPDIMSEYEIDPFDVAVLNMVLHSVDDESCRNILTGVRKCLKPTGAVVLTVPSEAWILEKLYEFATDRETNEENINEWIGKQMNQPKVEIPMRIRGGDFYDNPLTVYQRGIEDYGKLLAESDFGFLWNSHDERTGNMESSVRLSYFDMSFRGGPLLLEDHARSTLLSFYFPDEYWVAWKDIYHYEQGY